MSKDYKNDFLAFFRDLYRVEGIYGPQPICPPFLVEFINLAFQDGKPAARNIGDFRTKKQGKSALAGAVALFMASRESYAEVVIAASDKDQAKDRVLRAVKFACQNGPLAKHARVYKDVIELNNQSTITALPMDWQGAAGGNYSAVIFDELFGYIHEGQRRLFDELIIPPTQPAGTRWIASYAGFLGESELLKEWWDRGLEGEKISQDLPIYKNHNSNLLAFIDVGPESWRMPWMTQAYIDEVRAGERENTFRRLWLNEWTAGESAFVPQEAWEACASREIKMLTEKDHRKIILGVDASTTRDITGMIGTWFNPSTKKAEVIYIRAVKPQRGFLRMGKPTIDLEAVKNEILRLHENRQLAAVYYDPYQMASIGIELERAFVRVREFPQTNQRTEADQQLYDAVVGGGLAHPDNPDLNEHIRNAIAVESVRGFRLAKDKTSMKIDLAVALSMSLYGTMLEQQNLECQGVDPNPFYIDLPEDKEFLQNKSGNFLISKKAPEVHPPGVTWQNCRHRNQGCPACIAELEAEGFFEQEAWAAELMREAHPEYEDPMDPKDQRILTRQLSSMPNQAEIERSRVRAAFRTAVRNEINDQ